MTDYRFSRQTKNLTASSTGSSRRATDFRRARLSWLALGGILSVAGCLARSEPRDQQPDRNRADTRLGRAAADRVPGQVASGGIVAVPLARRSPPAKALFDRLPAAETGVDFQTNIAPHHEMSRLYHSGFVSGGIAVGDIDQDGRSDLYLVHGPEKNRLYRQVADFRFEDITEQAHVDGGASWGAGAAFVDIDDDGDLDLYVCNYDAPNQLYVNDGRANFAESASLWKVDVVDASLMPVFCDYDRDGDVDLYLVTNRYYRAGGRPREQPFRFDAQGVPVILPKYQKYYALTLRGPGKYSIDSYGRPDRLLRNNGKGGFEDVTEQAGIAGHGHGLSATWWDYDTDGWPDLYVCNDFDDPDRLYRNNGDGTFADVLAETVPHTTWFSMGSDAGDINNDGLPDFFAVDMSATNHFKQKTTMGVMNAEKLASVAGPPPQLMRNALFVNSGTTRFWETAYLSGVADSNWSWAAKLADFDNDGWLDLFVSNGHVRSFNDSDRPIRDEMLIGRSEWDIFRDAPTRPEQNLTFRNRSDLRFEDVSGKWGLDHVGMSYAVALADLDRDGDLDVITMNVDEPVSLFRNNSQLGHAVTIRLQGRQSNRYGLGAVVHLESKSGRQSRWLHPMSGYLSSNAPLVHFGLGRDEVIERLTVSWPSGRRQTFEKLSANQHYTIAEPPPTATARSVPGQPSDGPDRMEPPRAPWFVETDALHAAIATELPFDDFQRQPLLPNKLSQLGPGLACGDVDGDGDEDIFVSGPAGRAGSLWINDGRGRFALADTPAFENHAASEDMGALFLDVDADRDLDLYVVSGGVECQPQAPELQDRLYLNDGGGGFTSATAGTLPEFRESGGPACAADFDRDGDLDLFVGSRVVPGRYPLSPRSRLLRNDAGKFTDVTEQVAEQLSACGMVTSAIWSDLNADDWLDLILATEWGPIQTFHNQQGRLVSQTVAAGLSSLTGWWHGLDSGDLDGDGDMDLVATNFGLNTKYHATREQPALLYYGDFGGNGNMELVEAEFEDGKLFPIRGKSCSTQAMPFLAEKFVTYRDFALADLTQLYTEQCLDQSHRFAATTLQSGVFLNDGSGRMTFRSLPNLAQVSAAFGVHICEMTGDAHADIYLVQNFFTPQPETGPIDGGLSLLLAGSGDGHFTPAAPTESGLVVAHDAKSLVATDLDGNGMVDFVVGVNDGPVRTFQHQESATGRQATVRLVGHDGNAEAVGARIQLLLSDGRKLTDEVQSGGGYLSQSSRALSFGIGRTTIREIQVHWPDGEQTTHIPREDERTLVIQRAVP